MNMSTKVITSPDVRWSYVSVFAPKSNLNGEAKYSVNLIIQKSDVKTVSEIKKAINEAYESSKEKLKFKNEVNPPSFEIIKNPLRDGDKERAGDPNYAGAFFINASSKNKPGVVDKNVRPIIDPNEVYSGCYGRASINFFAFNVQGSRGIACGLNNLQKVRDGDRLSGGATAEQDFAEFKSDNDFLD